MSPTDEHGKPEQPITYDADLENRFQFHPANSEAARDAHQGVREACHSCASVLVQNTPKGREQSLAITKIEEAMFWANAAVARARGTA